MDQLIRLNKSINLTRFQVDQINETISNLLMELFDSFQNQNSKYVTVRFPQLIEQLNNNGTNNSTINQTIPTRTAQSLYKKYGSSELYILSKSPIIDPANYDFANKLLSKALEDIGCVHLAFEHVGGEANNIVSFNITAKIPIFHSLSIYDRLIGNREVSYETLRIILTGWRHHEDGVKRIKDHINDQMNN